MVDVLGWVVGVSVVGASLAACVVVVSLGVISIVVPGRSVSSAGDANGMPEVVVVFDSFAVRALPVDADVGCSLPKRFETAGPKRKPPTRLMTANMATRPERPVRRSAKRRTVRPSALIVAVSIRPIRPCCPKQ